MQKQVMDGAASAELSSQRFIYNGWDIIAEYAVSGGTTLGALQRTYAWGIDMATSLSDAGGVGALLQLANTTTGTGYMPTYDGNGNVASLVNLGTGAVAAAFEYSPYGEMLRDEVLDNTLGTYALKFSTKWTDVETGWSNYGRRYYDPRMGRFIGRDPIAETGGLNLYAFCGNNGVNRWDKLGMESMYMDGGGEFGFAAGAGGPPPVTSATTSIDAANERMSSDFVMGRIIVRDSLGVERLVNVTRGMADSTAPISSLFSMGTVIGVSPGGIGASLGSTGEGIRVSGPSGNATVTIGELSVVATDVALASNSAGLASPNSPGGLWVPNGLNELLHGQPVLSGLPTAVPGGTLVISVRAQPDIGRKGERAGMLITVNYIHGTDQLYRACPKFISY